MKYQINKDQIIFDRLLYKIVIPNDSFFACILVDIRKTIGVNQDVYVGLIIESAHRKYMPWYGLILNSLVDKGNLRADVYGLETIEKFLLELKENGYAIGNCLDELQKAKDLKITFFGKG
ncbi:MAG: hypothetical protein WCO55_03645 [Candidatus Falkowbacteria bacterium]